MYYCGDTKDLLKYGFKERRSLYYEYDGSYYKEFEYDLDLIIDKNKKIYIGTTDQTYTELPDIILELYDKGLIKI